MTSIDRIDLYAAGNEADRLIATEVAVQDKMWGEGNERADAEKGQMLEAAVSQLVLVHELNDGEDQERAVAAGLGFYPEDWDGFRSYGSKVANLVVAAAFIRSEIKRLIYKGEDTTRTKRGEDYRVARPNMSSDEALSQINGK